jgi:glutathione S-transferase
MKIYDFTQAPNPRRVRVFLAEKGISVPLEPVNLGTADNRKPEFLKKNPLGLVPVLELDDGTCIAESIAICRYFEAQKPEPCLFGTGAKEQAIIEMWQRRMESEILGMAAGTFRNTSDFFKGRIPQVKEYGEVCRAALIKRFEWLDSELANRKYIAGDKFSVADITALIGVDFARASGVRVTPEQANLARWHAEVSARPSAKA